MRLSILLRTGRIPEKIYFKEFYYEKDNIFRFVGGYGV